MLLQPNPNRLVITLNCDYDGSSETYHLEGNSYLELLLSIHYIIGKTKPIRTQKIFYTIILLMLKNKAGNLIKFGNLRPFALIKLNVQISLVIKNR